LRWLQTIRRFLIVGEMFEYGKISPYRVRKIVTCFCIGIDATKTAQLRELHRKTVNRSARIFRTLIHAHQTDEKARCAGTVEVDESFSGPSRIRGRPGPRKGGCGTLKQPVFGIYERNGRVYTGIIPDCSAKTLQDIIRGGVDPEGVVQSGPTNTVGSTRARISRSTECTSTESKPSGA